ncbi:MAG: chorismate pyruvate-lyase family protein [Actinomycetota bacterium]|nr:chorismate pyruvate-lyase family protein [Actinomycetota bacterium]
MTDVLEVYTGEPMRVVILEQMFEQRAPNKPELDADRTEQLLHRTVLLQGVHSGTNFIHAASIIAPDRLPPRVLAGLLETGKPIGRLLAADRVETFREIVGLGYEPAGDLAPYFGVDPASSLVFRTYRIHVQQQPVMRITEKFPATWFSRVLDI